MGSVGSEAALFCRTNLKQAAHMHQPMHAPIHIPRTVAAMDSCFAGSVKMALSEQSSDGYAMLMRSSEGETAVHGCHCLCDMAVRMREVLARPWVGVCVVCLVAIPWSACSLNPV